MKVTCQVRKAILFSFFSIVARVAYDILKENSPDALEKANDLLKVLSESDPSITDSEGDYPFVESAIFADEIKRNGGGYQSGWHFVDTPLVDAGTKKKLSFPVEEYNITLVVPQIVNWLQEDGDYQDSYVYEQVMQQVNDENSGKSYALRLLIHYLGDVH